MRPFLYRLLHTTLPELAREIWQVSATLFRIMIPVLIVVKMLEELGAIPWLASLMTPLMAPLGLPESMGLVWTTTLITNIYGGMLVFYQLAPGESLSVAQVSILGTMMLIAHNLPVELRIVQRAGVRLATAFALRFGGALALGGLLHLIYTTGGWLQQPLELVWAPVTGQEETLADWALAQLRGLAMILAVIAALLTLLRLLRWLHVERLMIWLLRPVLRLMGIAPEATSLTIIGITLGLAYGGGLLIREAESGQIRKQDVFAALALLSLCHSLIEDTLLILAIGADLSAILWARLLFSLLVVALLVRWMGRTDEAFQERWLVRSVARPRQ